MPVRVLARPPLLAPRATLIAERRIRAAVERYEAPVATRMSAWAISRVVKS